MPKSASIYVLVPTYDRAAKTTVVAEVGNEEILSNYEEELARLGEIFCDKVMYELTMDRFGSVNARNRLLKLVG